jgi:hypothetical protein
MSGRFLCVDRHDARLPDFFAPRATAVIVAGSELLQAFELAIWLDYPLGWTMVSEIRGRSQNGKLEVAKLGLYWFIGRRQSDCQPISETIVEAFGQAPMCTHTPCAAMLAAEGCDANLLRFSIGMQWARFD